MTLQEELLGLANERNDSIAENVANEYYPKCKEFMRKQAMKGEYVYNMNEVLNMAFGGKRDEICDLLRDKLAEMFKGDGLTLEMSFSDLYGWKYTVNVKGANK